MTITSGPSDTQLHRVKRLTQALIISMTINAGLIATFFYFALQENETPPALELQPVMAKNSLRISNEELLRTFSMLSYQELLSLLDNLEQIEEGFCKRDLALSCLVAFHHFNLERALSGKALPLRQIFFSNSEGKERADIALFPGVSDEQYLAIMNFAKREKWPLTSQGLFFEIQRSIAPREPSLLEAFFLTPEYRAAATLFAKAGLPLEKEKLIDLLAEGSWRILDQFTQQQKLIQELTPAKLRSFLIEYLEAKSKIAAKILLHTDIDSALKRLDDAQVVALLEVMTEKSSELENFAKNLLLSPRSDLVWKKAASKLYHFAGEEFPEPYDHIASLRRFFPQSAPPIATPKAPSEPKLIVKPKAKRTHLIQEGDSLWKIARRYHVPIEALMKQNNLESEKLRPGKTLEIP